MGPMSPQRFEKFAPHCRLNIGRNVYNDPFSAGKSLAQPLDSLTATIIQLPKCDKGFDAGMANMSRSSHKSNKAT